MELYKIKYKIGNGLYRRYARDKRHLRKVRKSVLNHIADSNFRGSKIIYERLVDYDIGDMELKIELAKITEQTMDIYKKAGIYSGDLKKKLEEGN